jgi:hypothetical protein
VAPINTICVQLLHHFEAWDMTGFPAALGR